MNELGFIDVSDEQDEVETTELATSGEALFPDVPLPRERVEETLALLRTIIEGRGQQVCEQEARLKYELGEAIARDWWDAGAAAAFNGDDPQSARAAVIRLYAEQLRLDPMLLGEWKLIAEKITPVQLTDLFETSQNALVGWCHIAELSRVGELKRDENGYVLPDEKRNTAVEMFVAGELTTITSIRAHKALVAAPRNAKVLDESEPDASVTPVEIKAHVLWIRDCCPADTQAEMVATIIANLPTRPGAGSRDQWDTIKVNAVDALRVTQASITQKIAALSGPLSVGAEAQ